MLFTRCPHCDTIFRVTDEALSKAGGRVRCGRCANVFDASSDLRESPTGAPLAPHAAALEDGARPAGDTASTDRQPPALAAPAPAEEPIDDAHDAASGADAASGSATPDAPAAATPPADAAAPDVTAPPGAAAAPDVTAPPDAAAALPAAVLATGGAPDGAAAAAADTGAQVAHTAVANPGAAPADGPGALPPDSVEISAAADSPSTISPAEIDEVLASMADAQSGGRAPRFGGARGRLGATAWRTGAILALLLLGAQTVHYFRRDLATSPLAGPLLVRLYAAAGNPLPAPWQAARYQPLDSSATESTNAGGSEIWTVSARFSNAAAFAQPYPLVRVEIKNRWEETLRRRDFTPDEYLARELPRGRLMQPREVAQASLELADPGADATGFVFDVCVEIETNVLSCRNDEVFR